MNAPTIFPPALSAFTYAVATFLSDGCTVTSRDELAARLSACAACPHRRGIKCGLCGCVLPIKARMRLERCPDVPGRWAGERADSA